MARKKARIKFHPDAFREIMRTPELVEGRAAAIAAACNAESSHGGYDYAVTVTDIRARARVWSYEGNGETRRNRMIRNLDAGS